VAGIIRIVPEHEKVKGHSKVYFTHIKLVPGYPASASFHSTGIFLLEPVLRETEFLGIGQLSPVLGP
jgi:hypothetical protein